MEDLQAALQSVLSDPAQMAQISALAESLGLKPPEGAELPDRQSAPQDRPPQGGGEAVPQSASPPVGLPGLEGLDLGKLMAGLSSLRGTEDRVLGALRPTLSPSGQAKADRAMRAAALSRLAGQLLQSRRQGHV